MTSEAERIALALGGTRSGDGWKARCPAHEDDKASLSIGEGRDGKTLLRCFANCSFEQIRDALQREGLWGKNGSSSRKANGSGSRKANGSGAPQGRVVASYDYRDRDGGVLYFVDRYADPKDFRRRPAGSKPNVLYRWPELVAAGPDATLFVGEGEKDVDRIRAVGLVATTVAHGSWKDVDVADCAGRDVIILEDADTPGVKKALVSAQALKGVAKTIRIVRLPGHEFTAEKHGKDVSDWLNDGHTKQELVDACFAAPLWVPPATPDLLMTSAAFIADFTPPDYLVDGLVQRRFIYSLTGPTGAGKTAVALLIMLHVSQGWKLAGRDVDQGKVLYMAGENPDDVRMRWIKLCEENQVDSGDENVIWRAGSLKLSEAELRRRITEETDKHGPFALVVVDTSAAFFEGDDENDNVQLGNHARMLRSYIDAVAGGPTIIVTCHPIKSFDLDNLLPRGGGAFLAEVDGNFVAIKPHDSMIVEMHWHGKLRGADFAPIPFQLTAGTSDKLKDSKGRNIVTVTARQISDAEQNAAMARTRSDQDRLMRAMHDHPGASVADLAMACCWLGSDNQPQKSRVHRILTSLKAEKFVEKRRGTWTLTGKGQKAVGE
jgi:5S rRNA maturation endonuclease (ribonuclease M5)